MSGERGSGVDPKKAYEFINNALAQLHVNRQTHQALIEALNILYNLKGDEIPGGIGAIHSDKDKENS